MYVFSGSTQRVELPSTLSHLAGSHAICFWMVPDVVSTERTITTDWNATYRNYLYRITGSKVEALSGNGANAQASAVTSATTLQIGTRYHVAIVRDGNVLKIYINGALDAYGDITGYTGGATSLSRYIGCDNLMTGTTLFDGTMEDYREYTRALSAAEIQTIFRSLGHDGITYGLELREPMDFLIGWAQNEKRTYTIPAPAAFIYYRLIAYDQDDTQNSMCIGEIELLDSGDADLSAMAGVAYTASSGTSENWLVAKAFDNAVGTNQYWACSALATEAAPQWAKVQFPTAQTVYKLTLQARNFADFQNMPTKFKLQGSNDDSTWTDLLVANGPGKAPRDVGPKKLAPMACIGGIASTTGLTSTRRRRR